MSGHATAILALMFTLPVSAQNDLAALGPTLVPPRLQIAPPVGTLFMSPEERAQIGKPPPPPAPAVAAPARRSTLVESPPPARSVLNGFVKRSDGVATIWVDGREKTGIDDALLEKITPESVGGSEETLRVTVGGEEAVPAQTVAKPRGKLKRTVNAKMPTLLRSPKVKPRRK